VIDTEKRIRQFKSGLWLCWLPALALPIGLLAIGGGPCARPNNVLGIAILLTIGGGCLGAAMYGIIRVSRGISLKQISMRIFGAFSICGACAAAFVGSLYFLVGILSLLPFLLLLLRTN